MPKNRFPKYKKKPGAWQTPGEIQKPGESHAQRLVVLVPARRRPLRELRERAYGGDRCYRAHEPPPREFVRHG